MEGRKLSKNKIGIGFIGPVDVVMDSNEWSKSKDIYRFLIDMKIRVAVKDIGAGDYLILGGAGQGIVVERKTVEDLINSIIDSRLWKQAARVSDYASASEYIPVLLIEGEIRDALRKRKLSSTALMRAIDTIAIEYGFRIIPSPGKIETARWIASRARATIKKPMRIYSIPTPKKPLGDDEKILASLALLVGRETAVKLLKTYGTLRNVVSQSIAELKRIEGIGEKRAKRIFYLFNRKVRLERGEVMEKE